MKTGAERKCKNLQFGSCKRVLMCHQCAVATSNAQQPTNHRTTMKAAKYTNKPAAAVISFAVAHCRTSEGKAIFANVYSKTIEGSRIATLTVAVNFGAYELRDNDTDELIAAVPAFVMLPAAAIAHVERLGYTPAFAPNYAGRVAA